MQAEQQIPSSDMIPLTEIDRESKRNWIKMMTKKKYINSIDYTEFKNIESLTTGGSGVIKKAVWIKKEKEVVLKKVLPDTSKIDQFEHEELVKEIKAFYAINDNINVDLLPNEEFFLVLEYADKGDLETYLIHNQLDDHSNLGIRAVITDFGLSRVVSRHSLSNQHVKGRMKFMDPIILNTLCKTFGKIYDYSSDIYSLGVIMWEISSNGQGIRRLPNQCVEMIYIICGVREEPVAGSTLSYVELYEKCWDKNPDNRPDINCVYELIHKNDILSGEKVRAESDSTTVEPELENVVNVIKQFYDNHPEDRIEVNAG
ncbi:15967_t:CDS:2 [Racocetra fulgida]|uniref:15967_t:CDS:1 n=1 Tax=Racocetra fulgida TaxID=60492 RepID=A0A9N9AB60_9GLOM|nr:15967_t:CDS:2 [Racocetra fulgida]